MPFREYSSFFQPEELDALRAAYNAAWQHLWATNHALTADQAAVLKKNLAQIILAAACHGKRDIERLKEIALRGVSGRSPTDVTGPRGSVHGDPKECRKNAFRCAELAAMASTAKAKETFSNLAKTWVTLAVEPERSHALIEELEPEHGR